LSNIHIFGEKKINVNFRLGIEFVGSKLQLSKFIRFNVTDSFKLVLPDPSVKGRERERERERERDRERKKERKKEWKKVKRKQYRKKDGKKERQKERKKVKRKRYR
jgi:hypothetical protein